MTPPRPAEAAVAAAEASVAAAKAAVVAVAAEADRSSKAAKLPADRLAVSPTEAARLLSISRATMYRLLDAKKIRAKKLGHRKTRIAVVELRRFLGEKT